MHKYLIVLTGPTGIGKTSTGLKLAKHFKTEIVSSDSRQIFKEMNIGTAVPNIEELSAIKHHLIQNHSIHENLNVSTFENEALHTINCVFETQNVVILVGGSMLYIDAICNGIDNMPDSDPEIRQMLNNKLKTEGIESMRFQLKKIDPDYYNSVDLKNTNRIIHALEISIITGKPYSTFLTKSKKTRPFSIIKIGLNCERGILHSKINTRVDNMVNTGLEEEAKSLYHLKHLNALNTVGYREFFSYFDGEISREKAIELIKRNSRRYARKQLTWFRKDDQMNWFEYDKTKEIISFIENQIVEQ
ncbi:MAG TPA: tRNA (adenosine(37)-N6)-dimethylallyltransferase MiaA [Draconibacterium sp.]|nr:tRNA (adenosine(37)-N6)-dimethylallyltransferase MiaA [Draconibacterium sp.]